MPPTATTATPFQQHLTGLEGLRAIAVLSVIFYHFGVSRFFEAGFFGVDIFFALSGFLISALLLREFRGKGSVDLSGFYIRRARRLVPAVFAMLIALLVLTPFLMPESFLRLRSDTPAALIYASNWWQIFSQQSYFERMGPPPLLQHLWSLAVEGQYYLVWPLIFVGLLRRFPARTTGFICAGLAIANALWMAWVYQFQIDGSDPSRAYLGSDTHLVGLLSGGALACWWNPWSQTVRHSSSWIMATKLAGIAAFGGLLYMILGLNEGQPFLYQGGFLASSVLSCLMILAVTTPDGNALPQFATRIWNGASVRWLGSRSYSLYLWHWPVFVWLKPTGVSFQEMANIIAVGLVLTGLFAEISYRWIESPFRAGARLGCFGTWPALAFGVLGSATMLSAVALPVEFLPFPAARFAAEAGRHNTSDAQHRDQIAATELATPIELSAKKVDTVSWHAHDPALGVHITAIGDSVLLGARDFLTRYVPGITVNAEIGRQASQGLKVVRTLRADAALSDTVVLHLGTNGYIAESHFRNILSELKDRDAVVVVNVHANRRWTAPNNDLIGRVVRDYQNVRVMDWNTVAAQNPEYFTSDGIHLTGRGVTAFSREILRVSGVETRLAAVKAVESPRAAQGRPGKLPPGKEPTPQLDASVPALAPAPESPEAPKESEPKDVHASFNVVLGPTSQTNLPTSVQAPSATPSTAHEPESEQTAAASGAMSTPVLRSSLPASAPGQ